MKEAQEQKDRAEVEIFRLKEELARAKKEAEQERLKQGAGSQPASGWKARLAQARSELENERQRADTERQERERLQHLLSRCQCS